MRTYILYTIFILLFDTCSCHDKPKEAVINTYKSNVQFNFYPSSGGDAIYKVDYCDGYLIIKNTEVSNTIFEKKFNLDDKVKIIELSNNIRKASNTSTEIILDSWRIELIINGNVFYNKSGIKIKDLPIEIRLLLDYLIKDSTVIIDLYDFS